MVTFDHYDPHGHRVVSAHPWPRVGVPAVMRHWTNCCFFVFSIGQILQVGDLPKGLKLPKSLKGKPKKYVLNGGSCIIGPDGKFLLKPQYEKEETIYFDLPPLKTLIKERMNLAVSGHYQRPDVFKLKVNKKRVK